MAVEDKYVNADIQVDKKAQPFKVGGAQVYGFKALVSVAAADDNGSIYRIANLPAEFVPYEMWLLNTAITGGTDYEIGLYEPGVGGAAKDLDVFLGTTSMASARAGRANRIDALGAVTAHADEHKRLFEFAGDSATTKLSSYDLAITANTVGTVDGTIALFGLFLQG